MFFYHRPVIQSKATDVHVGCLGIFKLSNPVFFIHVTADAGFFEVQNPSVRVKNDAIQYM